MWGKFVYFGTKLSRGNIKLKMHPLTKNIRLKGGGKVTFFPFFKSSFRVVASHLDDNLTVLSKTEGLNKKKERS